MKKLTALAALTLFLSLPALAAEPRRTRDREMPSIGRIAAKLVKKVFGITTNDTQPVVPRP